MRYQDLALIGLYAETSLHCGDEGSQGFIDLPVQRERHTEYPVIPGSTLKGVLRSDVWDRLGKDEANRVFGSQDDKGGICVSDGMIVAFPVRSLLEPFFWVTCPFALERFRRIGKRFNVDVPKVNEVGDGKAVFHAGENRDVSLEDVLVSANTGLDEDVVNAVANLLPNDESFGYTREALRTRLLVVSDGFFRDFVKTATDVVTRIRIEPETGTVATGALFAQELVPADSVFVSAIRGVENDPVNAYFEDFKTGRVIRIGADETIGRGLTHVAVVRNGGAS